MTTIRLAARLSPRTRAVTGAARFGLGAQAVVYLVLGWLAIRIAAGHGSHPANQHGALAELASHQGGIEVLYLLAGGFASYAIWRFSEAALGSRTATTTGERVLSGLRGVAYGGLCVTTLLFLAGRDRGDPGQQQSTWTGRAMRTYGGRWLITLIGLVVVAVGIGMFLEAAMRRFERQLDVRAVPEAARPVVETLGVYGSISRAVVVALVGALIVEAAVTADPAKSDGLDGALRTLADRPYGPWLLGVIALGFLAFGAYAAAVARWVKT